MLENIDISLVKCVFGVNTSILFALAGGCWRPAGGLLAACWRSAGAGWRLLAACWRWLGLAGGFFAAWLAAKIIFLA